MSKYKEGDRFIVEIADIQEGDDNCPVYKFKHIGTIFSEKILTNLEQVQKDAGSFDEGVMYAEIVYRKLHSLSTFEFNEIFKLEGGSTWSVIQKYSAEQIDEMMQEFTPRVEVGDKFLINADEGSSDSAVAITYIDKDADTYYYIHKSGRTGSIVGTDNFIKKVRRRIGRPVQGGAYKSAFDFIFDARGDKE